MMALSSVPTTTTTTTTATNGFLLSFPRFVLAS